MQENQSVSPIVPSPISTSNTLKDIVIAAKIRKGKAAGTTKKGAFWIFGEIQIRSWGGDGVGINGARCKNILELRHYRDGRVSAQIRINSWHQNEGHRSAWFNADSVLESKTAEDLIVALKATDADGHAIGNGCESDVVNWASEIGLPEAEPAPDEVLNKIIIDSISPVFGGWDSGYGVDVALHVEDTHGTRDGFETRRVSLDRDRLIRPDGSFDQDAVNTMVEKEIFGKSK